MRRRGGEGEEGRGGVNLEKWMVIDGLLTYKGTIHGPYADYTQKLKVTLSNLSRSTGTQCEN